MPRDQRTKIPFDILRSFEGERRNRPREEEDTEKPHGRHSLEPPIDADPFEAL